MDYSIENLKQIEDSADGRGSAGAERRPRARGGPVGLELLAFGPRHESDGEIVAIDGFWKD